MAATGVAARGKVRRGIHKRVASRRVAALLALCVLNAACSTLNKLNPLASNAPPEGQVGHVQGFLGGVVADEPRAALIGRDVLSTGGDAADAAVAIGFALAATLPSRAGIGAGGACIAYAPDTKSTNGGVPEAVIFTPLAPSGAGPNADRPAALPMMARGLFLLHARYGRRPFESLMVPAEQLARFGLPVSRALAQDIAAVSGPLFADPNARAVFSHNGVPLREGDALIQSALGSTLAQMRTAGVGDLYQGVLARRVVQESPLIGGPLSDADLRNALPRFAPALVVPWRSDKVAFLPPPADGGLAAAVAFNYLQAHPSDFAEATALGLAAAARWRQGGATAEQIMHMPNLPQIGLPALPASTSFATLDRNGNAVTCSISLGNLFGTGRILPNLGFLLAASPAAVPPPLYAAALAWNEHLNGFRAEISGSGQAGAPMAVAVGMLNALSSKQPMPVPVPDPGRANAIACNSYLPGAPETCALAVDPRSAGLAMGGS